MPKIAILSSSEGLRFQSLIDSKKSGQLKAEIVCLVTDKADCGAALKARAAKIRVYYFDPRGVDPAVFENEVAETLEFFKIDQVAVEGYGHPTDALEKRIEAQWVRLDSDEAVVRLVQGRAQ